MLSEITRNVIDLPRDNVTSLRDAASEYYKRQIHLERLFDNTPISVLDSYINLSVLESQMQEIKEAEFKTIDKAKSPQNIEKESWKEECMPSYETLFEVKKPIELSKLFHEKNQAAPTKLLVQGRAGIGKSILCQYLAVQWACGEQVLPWLQKFEVVFWLKLRDVADLLKGKDVKLGTLEHVVHASCLGEGQYTETLTECLRLEKIRSNCLFILDGFDEISSTLADTGNSDMGALRRVWSTLVEQEHVIVTSRPVEFPFWSDKAGKNIRQLEIMGFTNENIEKYTSDFIHSALQEENKVIKESRTSTLLQHLKSHPSIWGVAHIPINLEILCWLYVKGDFKPTASHLSGLYKEIVSCVVREMSNPRKRKEKKRAKYLSLEQLFSKECSQKTKEMGQYFLETLAYEGMKNNELLISSQTIKKAGMRLLKQYSLDANDYSLIENLVLAAQNLGFIKSTQKGGHALQEQSHYFIHLSFQEFFAAQHVANVLVSGSEKNEPIYGLIVEHFQKNKYESRYQLMWWLTAGLLNLKCQESNDFSFLIQFWEMIDSKTFEPLIKVEHNQLTLHCLDECLVNQEQKYNFDYQALLEKQARKISYFFENLNHEGSYLTLLNRYYISLLRCKNILMKENILTILLDYLGSISKHSHYFRGVEILDVLSGVLSDSLEKKIKDMLENKNLNNHIYIKILEILAMSSKFKDTKNEVIDCLLRVGQDEKHSCSNIVLEFLLSIPEYRRESFEILLSRLGPEDVFNQNDIEYDENSVSAILLKIKEFSQEDSFSILEELYSFYTLRRTNHKMKYTIIDVDIDEGCRNDNMAFHQFYAWYHSMEFWGDCFIKRIETNYVLKFIEDHFNTFFMVESYKILLSRTLTSEQQSKIITSLIELWSNENPYEDEKIFNMIAAQPLEEAHVVSLKNLEFQQGTRKQTERDAICLNDKKDLILLLNNHTGHVFEIMESYFSYWKDVVSQLQILDVRLTRLLHILSETIEKHKNEKIDQVLNFLVEKFDTPKDTIQLFEQIVKLSNDDLIKKSLSCFKNKRIELDVYSFFMKTFFKKDNTTFYDVLFSILTTDVTLNVLGEQALEKLFIFIPKNFKFTYVEESLFFYKILMKFWEKEIYNNFEEFFVPNFSRDENEWFLRQLTKIVNDPKKLLDCFNEACESEHGANEFYQYNLEKMLIRQDKKENINATLKFLIELKEEADLKKIEIAKIWITSTPSKKEDIILRLLEIFEDQYTTLLCKRTVLDFLLSIKNSIRVEYFDRLFDFVNKNESLTFKLSTFEFLLQCEAFSRKKSIFLFLLSLVGHKNENNDFEVMYRSLTLIQKHHLKCSIDDEIFEILLNVIFNDSVYGLDVKDAFDVPSRYRHLNPMMSVYCNTPEDYAKEYWVGKHLDVLLGIFFSSEKNLKRWMNSKNFKMKNFVYACLYLSDKTSVFLSKDNQLSIFGEYSRVSFAVSEKMATDMKSTFFDVVKDEILYADLKNEQPMQSYDQTPLIEGDQNMLSMPEKKELVKYELGKMTVLPEQEAFISALDAAVHPSTRISQLGWIDKSSPEQLLLRKIVKGSTTESIQKTLVDNPSLKHNADFYGNLPLHWVAVAGRSDLVPVFKKQIFSPKEFNKFGLAPWHMAAIFDQTSTLSALVNHFGEAHYKCTMHYKSLTGNVSEVELSPFHTAILKGREAVVNWYLNRDDFEDRVENFGNIFHLAVCGGQTTVLNLLLNHPKLQSRLNLLEQLHDVEKLSVLSYAAAQNRYLIIHELLTHYQRNAKRKEHNRHKQDEAALKKAVEYGALESVQVLVEMGTQPNFQVDYKKKNGKKKEVSLKTLAEKLLEKNPASEPRKDILTYIDTVISGHQENQYKILEVNQRRVKNLVFKGGGIKGLAYAGVYQALCYALPQQSGDPQAIEGIERVAGTSAGAMTAMAVALGFTAVQFNQFMREAPFERFLEDIKPEVLKNKGFWNKLSGLFKDGVNAGGELASFLLNPLFYSAELLKTEGLSKGEIIMAWLSRAVAKHLMDIREKKPNSSLAQVINSICHLEKSSQIDLEEVIKHGLKDEQLLKLTFGQLNELVRLDKRFKHLFTVALRVKNPIDPNIKEGLEVMHSESEWDQVLVIDAVRASISIPGVFVPHQIRQCNQNGILSLHSTNHYVDGGMLKNYPIELFDKFRYLPGFFHGDAEKPEPNPFTIGFCLMTPEQVQKKVATTLLKHLKECFSQIMKSVEQGIKRETAVGFLQGLGSLYYHAEDIIADFQNTRAGRTIQVSDAGVGTLEFGLSVDDKNKLIENGEKAVCEAYGLNYEDYHKHKTKNQTPISTQLQRSEMTLSTFLQFVAEGEQAKAETMLKENPTLASEIGALQDPAGRTFEQITGFQYALWALDWHMWEMIRQYIPKESLEGQLKAFERRVWVQTQRSSANWQDLIDGLDEQLTLLSKGPDENNGWENAKKQWNDVVGRAQRRLPAHVVNEYCHPDRSFKECPDFKSSAPLPRIRLTDREEDWYKSPRTFYRGDYKEARSKSIYSTKRKGESIADGRLGLKCLPMDRDACSALLETRKSQRDAFIRSILKKKKRDKGRTVSSPVPVTSVEPHKAVGFSKEFPSIAARNTSKGFEEKVRAEVELDNTTFEEELRVDNRDETGRGVKTKMKDSIVKGKAVINSTNTYYRPGSNKHPQ